MYVVSACNFVVVQFPVNALCRLFISSSCFCIPLHTHANTGNIGRYGNGDVQWLTTGNGALHSEVAVNSKEEKGRGAHYDPKGTNEDGALFQVWVCVNVHHTTHH
jgi:hypothetical protein